MHINILEMKAALIAIQSYLKTDLQLTGKRILLQMDNTTAVAYINKRGGTKPVTLTKVALDIWTLCQSKNITLVAQHLPDAQKSIADVESRQMNARTEHAYRIIGVYKSGISQFHDLIDGKQVGSMPVVSRFIKGIFEMSTTWPVGKVHPARELSFQAFPENSKVCVVKCYEKYFEHTQNIKRNEQQLLISYKKPHKAICSQTLSRCSQTLSRWYLRSLLVKAGISVEYTGHFTISASTSEAVYSGVSMELILDAADWSSATIFEKHFFKTHKYTFVKAKLHLNEFRMLREYYTKIFVSI